MQLVKTNLKIIKIVLLLEARHTDLMIKRIENKQKPPPKRRRTKLRQEPMKKSL